MGDDERQSSVPSLPPIATSVSSDTQKLPINKAGRKTPTIRKREASPESETPLKVSKIDSNGAKNTVKRKVEDEIPVLNAEEQAAADDRLHSIYQRGARVFAIYGKDYYPAIVDGTDGLGRYKIFFTEDLSTRTIPRDGVFPLHYVKENFDVTVIGESDEHNERAIYQGKILSIPSITNIEEWHRGIFNIEVQNEEHPESESREIKWVDIYFSEAQYKTSIKSAKRFTPNHQGI